MGVDVRIKLDRVKDDFALIADANIYNISIQKATFVCQKSGCKSSVMLAHEKALERGLLKMPIRRVGGENSKFTTKGFNHKPFKLVFRTGSNTHNCLLCDYQSLQR